jgi:predicted transcriptional regulator
MKPFCEAVVLEILPAVRAMVATKLVTDYGFSQKQAASRMGITQPAVSQYKRSLRGNNSDVFELFPQLKDFVNSIAAKVASGSGSPSSHTLMFCELCRKIRLGGMGCQAHRKRDPSLSGCAVCLERPDFYGGEARKRKHQAPVKPLNKFAR